MVFVKLLIVLAICLNLPVVAFAHQGKTDSNGGHTNLNTGEYHYHHGYSAHQHSDLDGDGDLDCPYQFVDKTDSSSKETKSFDEQLEEELEKLKKGNANSKHPTKPKSNAKPSADKQKEKMSSEKIILIGSGSLLGVGIVADSISNAIKRKNKK